MTEDRTQSKEELPSNFPAAEEEEPAGDDSAAAAAEERRSLLLLGEHGTPETSTEFVHPEGGWGWLVMLSAMWCNGSVFGIQNACGVIFVVLIQEFGSKDDPQLTFKTAMQFLGGAAALRQPSSPRDNTNIDSYIPVVSVINTDDVEYSNVVSNSSYHDDYIHMFKDNSCRTFHF